MRLIDADALLQQVSCEANFLPCGKEATEIALEKWIKSQPTACDIDKVVKELEERTDFLKDCTKYGNKNAVQREESYSTIMMYEVADLVDDLIGIVKQGGVSDDACEWYCDDYGRYHTKCHTLAENDPLEYTYCPYCGKKIKVVE